MSDRVAVHNVDNSIQFMAEPYEGRWYSCVHLPADISLIFLGKQIDVLDIEIFEGSENTGTVTSQKGGCLTLKIPLAPEEFSQLEENPTIAFDITNDFEDENILKGVRFDRWVAKGHNWARDVVAETTCSLEEMVMFSFHAFGVEEAIAA